MYKINDKVVYPGHGLSTINSTREVNVFTCSDYAEALYMRGDFDSVFEDMYWCRDYSSDRLFDLLKNVALSENICLSDVDDWNYDKWFYFTYKDTEKGLS